MIWAAVVLATVLTQPPPEAARLVAPTPELGPIAARLPGSYRLSDGVLTVVDIAGDGPAWIGVVERRGDALFLRTAVGTFKLRGNLARPRIAGPSYLVWVQGTRFTNGDDDVLMVRRLGVMAAPGGFADLAGA